MPPVQYTASMQLKATPDMVTAALVEHLDAVLQPDGTLHGPIPDDPSDSGRFEFTVALTDALIDAPTVALTVAPSEPSEAAAPTDANDPHGTTLEIVCANESQLPYFNGVVDSVMLLHYEKAAAYAAGVIRHELEGNDLPSKPKKFPLLPPVPYSNEQATMLVTAGFAIAVATFGQSIVGQYGS